MSADRANYRGTCTQCGRDRVLWSKGSGRCVTCHRHHRATLDVDDTESPNVLDSSRWVAGRHGVRVYKAAS